MDITFFRTLSVVFMAIAFAGVCWWAFSPSRRKKFDEAANMPFADEELINRDKQNNNLHLKKDEERQD